MKNVMIQYCFQKKDNSRENFQFELDGLCLELVGNIPDRLPYWTELDYYQCPNCPFDIVTRPDCPLAVNMVDIVSRFEDLISFDEIFKSGACTYSKGSFPPFSSCSQLSSVHKSF